MPRSGEIRTNTVLPIAYYCQVSQCYNQILCLNVLGGYLSCLVGYYRYANYGRVSRRVDFHLTQKLSKKHCLWYILEVVIIAFTICIYACCLFCHLNLIFKVKTLWELLIFAPLGPSMPEGLHLLQPYVINSLVVTFLQLHNRRAQRVVKVNNIYSPKASEHETAAASPCHVQNRRYMHVHAHKLICFTRIVASCRLLAVSGSVVKFTCYVYPL